MNFTIARPPEIYDTKDQSDFRVMVERITRFLFESTNALTSRGITAKIAATVTNDTADLSVEIAATKIDFPIAVKVYEGQPSGTPLVDTSLTESATLTEADFAALGNRALPLRELQKWWVLLTDVHGVEHWFGPTAADRDSLPYAAVTTKDSIIRVEYDDDVDSITITLPNGATKVFTTSGGGTATYTVADAVTTGSVETALVLDEVRDGYRVDIIGGGETRTIFRGALRGPKSESVAASLKAVVTNDTADLTLALAGSASAWPVSWSVYEDTPDSAAIATGSALAASTITKVGVPALGGRTLPLRELRRWWVKTIDANGATLMWGPTSADRDALPNGAVTAADSVIKVDYDDDTDTVKVTTPAGGVKIKTYSGLTGSGTVTYTVGDVLDDASTEAALSLDEKRGTYLVEVHGGGAWRTVFRGKLYGPKGDNVTAKLSAVVTNDTADLTLVIAGTATAFPVIWSVYEDVPSGSPIATGTATTGTTYTPAGTGAFDNIALPLREVKRWYVKTVDTHGNELWFGPTSADRDSLPYGTVTPLNDTLKCEYDDDVDSIKVTVPGGAFKTFSGLSGGGTVTYTVGDSMTSGSAEAALADDEVRGTYLVEYTGGGETQVFYRGSLRGSNKDFTQPMLDVLVTPSDEYYTFEYTSDGTVLEREDAGSFSAAPASPFDIFRNELHGAEITVQIKATGANGTETDPRTFSVPPMTTVGPSATFEDLVVDVSSGTSIVVYASVANFPDGTVYDIIWSITGVDSGTVSDLLEADVNFPGYEIIAAASATTNGSVTLRARLGLDVLATLESGWVSEL